VPDGNVEPDACDEVKDCIVQLSDAVGAVQVTTDVHVIISDGQFEITGSSSSVTVTTCEHVAELPLKSVTVQVTVVLPTGNNAGASFVTVFTLQLSLVTGTESVTPDAPQYPVVLEMVVSFGQVIVGAMSSRTVKTVLDDEKQLFPSVYVTLMASG
jgi:hypothetical protein